MKKNHHYVPQFYLRNFSDNGKYISMYINETGKYIKTASINEQASKKYLYGKDQTLEDTFAELEGHAATIIRNILESLTLPQQNSDDYQILLQFILLSEARVQNQADSYENLITEQMKVISKMYKNHGRLDVPESVIDSLKVSLSVPNLLSIKTASEMFPILFDLKLVILISDNDRCFITSDKPTVRYNFMYVKRNYQIRGYGLGNMGIQIFFPISSKCCLYLYDDIMYKSIVTVNNKIYLTKGTYVDELNKLFYLNSYKYLFFNERVNESYIKRIIANLDHDISIDKEVVQFGTADEKLIMYQNRYVKDRINMPFLYINPELVNLPLPPHMAGPIRPYAKKFGEEEDE